MRILIAEDDPETRLLLEGTLGGQGHELVLAADGDEAWAALQREDAPPLAVLDWMMPGLEGVEVCRRVRQRQSARQPAYVIILTARSETAEVVEGLEAGANDYVTKPFAPEELRARVRVGVTVVELQRSLAERVRELEEALAEVKQLRGILPICGYCKKIRDDADYWQQLESYISKHSEARFSHSICPDCYAERVLPELERMKKQRAESR